MLFSVGDAMVMVLSVVYSVGSVRGRTSRRRERGSRRELVLRLKKGAYNNNIVVHTLYITVAH